MADSIYVGKLVKVTPKPDAFKHVQTESARVAAMTLATVTGLVTSVAFDQGACATTEAHGWEESFVLMISDDDHRLHICHVFPGWTVEIIEHPEKLTAEMVVDLLSLVGVFVTEFHVDQWTLAQWHLAADWAGAVHADASDIDGVMVLDRPKFLPEECRAYGLGTPSQLIVDELDELRIAVDQTMVESWTLEERERTHKWIVAVRADKRDQLVEVPERPAFLPAPCFTTLDIG